MSAVAARPATAPIAPMLVRQSFAEFIKLIRVPAFSVTSIVLPSMFYAFIGLGQAKEPLFPGAQVTFGQYFLASMALYGVANVMVLGFGISLANERGQKQDLLMKSTPLPAPVYFTAKALSALAVAFIFALGYIAGPNSAPAVTNLIYLPTAFASGLFFPLRLLPHFLQNIAPYLPLYRAAQLVWDSVGAPIESGSISTDWLYMAGYAVGFFALALWAYRRDQGKKFN